MLSSLSSMPTLAPIAAKLSRHSSLNDADIREIEALPHHVRRFEHGTYLVREGDRTECCCGLLAGFAFRHKVTGDGGRQILAVHLKGDLVDLQNSLFNYADDSVQALTRVDAVCIAHTAIMDLAERRPAIGRALLKYCLIESARLREWIVSVGRRDARQRIAHLFCELALRQKGAGLGTGPCYEWPMTQEQVGDATGMTSVHVNRTLQGLRADGLVAVSKSSVTILDWDRLEATGDFNRNYLHEPAA